MQNNSIIYAQKIASVIPPACARISGEKGIHGNVSFYATLRGVLIVAEIYGLPTKEADLEGDFLHVDLFNKTSSKKLCELINNGGYAWCAAINEVHSLKQLIGQQIGIQNSNGCNMIASGRIEGTTAEPP